MDRDQIVESLRRNGCASAVFADAQLRARELRGQCEKEGAALSAAMFSSLAIGGAAFAGAVAVGSVMGPVTLIAVGGATLWAVGTHFSQTVPIADRAREYDDLLSDATPEEWATLAEICGSPEDLMDCFRAGFVMGDRQTLKGSRYHAALTHAHGLGKALPSEFVEPTKTGFAAPIAPRSWRDAEVAEVESAPTNAEIALVAKLCNERAGVRVVADRITALRDINRQGALNLAIVHAGISDRDYVKAGLSLSRLRLIKRWALEGDQIEATPVVVIPPAAPLSIVQPAPVQEIEEESWEDDGSYEMAMDTGCIWDETEFTTIEPVDLGNTKEFPLVLVVAGQGTGKTATVGHIFEQLSGNKALFTPKMDDHRNPTIASVYDLKFGFNPVTQRGAWFGNQDSFDNKTEWDLDWYRDEASSKNGSALDFIFAANQTAVNRTANGICKDRTTWRVFYDEAAQTYSAGFSSNADGRKGEADCQWFLSANLKPAIFNWRAAGVQLFVGCQSETVENIGLKGCAEARDQAWHLYPGPSAIAKAIKCRQMPLANFLRHAMASGYAIALLEKEGQQFKIVRMPRLSELARFDPIAEEPKTLADVELEDLWGDDEIVEESIGESIEIESLDAVAARIMAMSYLSINVRLQMIEATQNNG